MTARARRPARLPAVLAAMPLLAGCTWQDMVESFGLRTLVNFFTAGPIADYQRNLMLITFGVLMFVLVPVFVLTLWFAWRYRASNTAATYRPEWHSSRLLEVFLWGGPTVIIIVLGTMTWISTFELDPYKPIEAEAEPVRVQAVALDWKWLFIYPDRGVATVNELAMPVDVPVALELTSATVMNAFMIPRLGSQIFAMSGMRTKLHLMASEPGSYAGRNYQYSGDGFHEMRFQAVATSRAEFRDWLEHAQSTGRTLDEATFRRLKQPGHDVAVIYYSQVAPELFHRIIAGYRRDGSLAPPRTAAGSR